MLFGIQLHQTQSALRDSGDSGVVLTISPTLSYTGADVSSDGARVTSRRCLAAPAG